jgi:hypothetical protein
MQFPDGSFFGSGSTESILYMLAAYVLQAYVLQAGNIENVTGFLLCNQMIYGLKNTLQKMNVILNL